MDSDIEQELMAFTDLDKAKFNALHRTVQHKHFEEFVAYHVLKRRYLPDIEKSDIALMSTGAMDDNQIDSLCILIDGAPVKSPEHALELIESVDEPSIDYIFIQSTTSERFLRLKMNDSVTGVKNFCGPRYFAENAALAAKRGIRAQITEALKDESHKVRYALFYVALGRWKDDKERNEAEGAPLGWRAFAENEIRASLGMEDTPEVQVVDADRLREFIAQNRIGAGALDGRGDPAGAAPALSYARTIEARELLPLPELPDIAKGYLGYLHASEYLKLLEREDGQGLLEAVAVDNVRPFQGVDNDVNREIADTLTSASRSQFLLRNNGVTIVAAAASWQERNLRLENYQIVNGLQTSNILYGQRGLLGPDSPVYVTVKIVVTKDAALRDAIVRSTNRQTAIADAQQTGQRPFLRKLEQAFADARNAAAGERLWLERREGEYEDDATIENRNRILNMTDMLGAMTATLLHQPHQAAAGEAAMRVKIPFQVFNESHRVVPYLTAARVLFLARDWLSAKGDQDIRRFEFHLAYGLLFLAEPFPSPKDFGTEVSERVCGMIDRKLDDPAKTQEAVNKAAIAIRNVIKNVDRQSRKWRDLPRTKKFSTVPIENLLKTEKSRLKWD